MKIAKPLNLRVILVSLFIVANSWADEFDSWTWLNPPTPPTPLEAVAFGAGRFVAVGDSSTVLISTDGLDWVQAQSPVPMGWFGAIAFGDGQFVALHNDASTALASILTSSDGATWSLRRSLAAGVNGSAAIAFGNGRFVVAGVAENPGGRTWVGTILTSDDGVNWAEIRPGVTNWLNGVGYGNGRFVIVGGNGTVLTSRDGFNWLPSQSGTPIDLNSVSYGNGQFVATGWSEKYIGQAMYQSSIILTSADAVTWVPRLYVSSTNSTALLISSMTYVNGRFVAVGTEYCCSAVVLTSPDGANWVDQLSATDFAYLNGIAFGNDRVVVVGSTFEGSASPILTSADGDHWVQPRSQETNDLLDITYGEGQFVTVGRGGTILASADRLHWELRDSGTTNTLAAVACGGGQFVAVGGDTDAGGASTASRILTSAGGVNWAPCQVGSTNVLTDVVYGRGLFVAVGERGTVLTSSDGTNWTRQLSQTDDDLYAIAFGQGRFLAAGVDILTTSEDGTSWAPHQSNRFVYRAAYGNGQFAGLTEDGTIGPLGPPASAIVTSSDGLNWVERETGLPALSGITYGQRHFVAVGDHIVTSSANGIDWSVNALQAPAHLRSIAYGDGHFLAVGDSGAILESRSIVTLSATQRPGTGRITLSLEGPVGVSYTIQTSPDMVSWQTVTNFTSVQPTTVIFDALPTASPRGFYRAYSH